MSRVFHARAVSSYGAVLGLGTKMFGTVDGVRGEAAGKVGFTKPKAADPQQYAKLVQIPYDSAWMKWGNDGDHIGSMSRSFAREVVAPLLVSGTLPHKPTAVARAAAGEARDVLKFPPPLPTSTPMASTIPSTTRAAVPP